MYLINEYNLWLDKYCCIQSVQWECHCIQNYNFCYTIYVDINKNIINKWINQVPIVAFRAGNEGAIAYKITIFVTLYRKYMYIESLEIIIIW